MHCEYLTPRQAAAYLGLASDKSLAKWRVIGGGPTFIKLGRLVRYRERDLAAWMDTRRRNSTSDPGPGQAA